MMIYKPAVQTLWYEMKNYIIHTKYFSNIFFFTQINCQILCVKKGQLYHYNIYFFLYFLHNKTKRERSTFFSYFFSHFKCSKNHYTLHFFFSFFLPFFLSFLTKHVRLLNNNFEIILLIHPKKKMG